MYYPVAVDGAFDRRATEFGIALRRMRIADEKEKRR
jgi:hypothetical protein